MKIVITLPLAHNIKATSLQLSIPGTAFPVIGRTWLLRTCDPTLECDPIWDVTCVVQKNLTGSQLIRPPSHFILIHQHEALTT